jgi:SWIRM domain
VPGHAAWFVHDAVHDIERQQLPEFFDGRAPSKAPQVTTGVSVLAPFCSRLEQMTSDLVTCVHTMQVYKQCRNAIIAKYREDVKRRLTYVDARAAVEVRL